MLKYHPTSISGHVHSVCEQLPTRRILHRSSLPRTIVLWGFWQWGIQPQSQHASLHDNPTNDDANTGFHLRPLLIPLLRAAWGEGRGTCHCPWLVSLVLLSSQLNPSISSSLYITLAFVWPPDQIDMGLMSARTRGPYERRIIKLQNYSRAKSWQNAPNPRPTVCIMHYE